MFKLRQTKLVQAVLPAIAAVNLFAPTLSSAGVDIHEIARNSILGVQHSAQVPAGASYETREIHQIARDSILGKSVGSSPAVVSLAGVSGQTCNADTHELARASILGSYPSLTC